MSTQVMVSRFGGVMQRGSRAHDEGHAVQKAPWGKDVGGPCSTLVVSRHQLALLCLSSLCLPGMELPTERLNLLRSQWPPGKFFASQPHCLGVIFQQF